MCNNFFKLQYSHHFDKVPWANFLSTIYWFTNGHYLFSLFFFCCIYIFIWWVINSISKILCNGIIQILIETFEIKIINSSILHYYRFQLTASDSQFNSSSIWRIKLTGNREELNPPWFVSNCFNYHLYTDIYMYIYVIYLFPG